MQPAMYVWRDPVFSQWFLCCANVDASFSMIHSPAVAFCSVSMEPFRFMPSLYEEQRLESQILPHVFWRYLKITAMVLR